MVAAGPISYEIEHGFYGCDTGCCGYRLTGSDGSSEWTFGHPDERSPSDEQLVAFARAEFDIPADAVVTIGEWRAC